MPGPVIVSVLPEIVAGPETTLKETGKPELEDADSATGETPYVTGDAGAVNVIVCAPAAIVKLAVSVAAV